MTDTPTPAQQLEEVLSLHARMVEVRRSGEETTATHYQREFLCYAAEYVAFHAPTLRRALAALEAVEWRPMRECPIDADVLLWNQETDEISIGMKPSDAPEDTAVIVDMTASWADWWRPLPPKPADAVEVRRG